MYVISIFLTSRNLEISGRSLRQASCTIEKSDAHTIA